MHLKCEWKVDREIRLLQHRTLERISLYTVWNRQSLIGPQNLEYCDGSRFTWKRSLGKLTSITRNHDLVRNPTGERGVRGTLVGRGPRLS